GQHIHGEVEQFDFMFRRKVGEPVQVLACTSPVASPTGQIVGALGMFTDITDRLAAEEERRELLRREQEARAQAEEAQQRLSLLADASALLASSLDYERTLTSLSRAVVPGMADWCIIHLIDDDGAVRNIAVTHADTYKAELADRPQRSEPH